VRSPENRSWLTDLSTMELKELFALRKEAVAR
jgi:hypothetical protein